MALPAKHLPAIEAVLSDVLQQPLRILNTGDVGGGCINACYNMRTGAGSFFVKINSADKFPGMFDAEAKGLQMLGEACPGFVPHVIALFEQNAFQYLILELLEPARRNGDFARRFASRLAGLHRFTSGRFGLDFDNYIGSLPQENTACNAWPDFFIHRRIEPVLKSAIDAGALDVPAIRMFDNLFLRLEHIFPAEPPALLHGDLWAGNCITGPNGYGFLIDPAVYFGHREMDIAMMHLFGGFDRDIFDSYHEIFPLEPGWKSRIPVCNLYPLLVHTVLFGGAYASQVKHIVQHFR